MAYVCIALMLSTAANLVLLILWQSAKGNAKSQETGATEANDLMKEHRAEATRAKDDLAQLRKAVSAAILELSEAAQDKSQA